MTAGGWLGIRGFASETPRQLETPSYVYDLAEVRQAHQLLASVLPESAVLHYSLKANAHPRVLRTLAAAGCKAEVSSSGELSAAIDAGFAPGEILYTGPGKRDTDVASAVSGGVRVFSVDSPTGIKQLDKIGERYGVHLSALLRINDTDPPPGAGLAMTGGTSQFGADAHWVRERPDLFANRAHVDVAGLHLYMGSNLSQEDDLLATFEHALNIATEIQTCLARPLPVLDLGGGFGAPYARSGQLPTFPNLRDRLAEMLDRHRPGWQSGEQRIVFESGRYLVASCGTLLSRVLDVKFSHGKRVVVLDTGVNHLGGISGLGFEDRVEPGLLSGCSDEGRATEALVVGPLCHPLDSWTRNGALADAAVGDVVAVPNVGAYGLVTGLTHFHGHPMPVEVVLDGDTEVERTRIVAQRSE